jgi:DNA polymerase III gamma/tau subunit
MEIYKKHRPTKLSEIIGQPEAISIVQTWFKENTVPHTVLLAGGSGLGKTSLARIIRQYLQPDQDENTIDYKELNCAKERGIDMVRDIWDRCGICPAGGKCRIWLLDECHSLTKDAMSSLLKMLEDTPKHVYFMLATTEPQKLLSTIKTRCSTLTLKSISESTLVIHLKNIVAKEKRGCSLNVIEAIVRASFGSVRQALVELDKVIDLPTEEVQLAAISSPTMQKDAFEIVKALLYYTKKPSWSAFVKTIQNVDTSEPERLRHFILACARTELRKANDRQNKAALILEVFKDPWYNEQESGLERCCFAVVSDE